MCDHGKRFLLFFCSAFFSVLTIHKLYEISQFRVGRNKIQNETFRAEFFSEELWKRKDNCLRAAVLLKTVKQEDKILSGARIHAGFQPRNFVRQYLDVRTQLWRKRGHEGIDIMALKNQRGLYPVLSMTDGVITNLGWLEQGGYRIGITAKVVLIITTHIWIPIRRYRKATK